MILRLGQDYLFVLTMEDKCFENKIFAILFGDVKFTHIIFKPFDTHPSPACFKVSFVLSSDRGQSECFFSHSQVSGVRGRIGGASVQHDAGLHGAHLPLRHLVHQERERNVGGNLDVWAR